MRHANASLGLRRLAGRAGPRAPLRHMRVHAGHRCLSTGTSGDAGAIPTPKPPPHHARSLLTLAIETSCDDTCVAVLERRGDAARLHFNRKITSDNTKFLGVCPVTAVESHMSGLAPLVDAAIAALPRGQPGTDTVTRRPDAAPGSWTLHRKPDFISVTRGPGMTSSLSVGLAVAKGLAVAWQVPLLAVHHMQAHALTPRLAYALDQPWPDGTPSAGQGESEPEPDQRIRERLNPAFPFLSLLVSGGHTQLLLSRSVVSHEILADAQNVAIGDMLDKCARLILPPDVLSKAGDVMYGAELETFAFPPSSSSGGVDYDYTPPATRAEELRPYQSAEHGWSLTPPLSQSREMAFDFSGLGGRVQAIMQQNPHMDEPQRRELARATMKLAFEHLASRVLFALEQLNPQGGKQPRSRKTAAATATTTTTTTTTTTITNDAHHRQTPQEDPPPTPPQPQPHPEPEPIKTLVVSGGVASNGFLRHVLRTTLLARARGGHGGQHSPAVVRPPPALCTDNAAMIAWAGTEMWRAGWRSGLEVLPVRRWPMGGGGILGAPGWTRRGEEGEGEGGENVGEGR